MHYLTLTLGSRSHKMLPSTLDIMWPMRQQSLIFLHPMVKEKIHLQENTLFDLDLRGKVTWKVAQCPLHNVTYAPTEFEVTTSKALGGEAFTRKFDIWPSTLGQGHTKCCPVPSTSCDLFSYKVWRCYVKRFMRRCIYKKIQSLTLTFGSRSHEMLPSTLYIMWPFQQQSLKLLHWTV